MTTLQSNFAHQQKSPTGYRLLHYSLDHFFTPTLSITVEGIGSCVRMGWLSLGKLFLFFLWIFPAILVPMLLINLGTEFKHMRQSLDHFAGRDHDPAKIPVPSTETIFITTTVFPPLPGASIATNDVKSQTIITSFTSSVSIITATSTPSILTLCTDDQSQTDPATFTSTPTPSSSSRLSENSLASVPALPFEWSKIRIELPPAAQKTVDRVLEGLGIVWEVFRKAYHYPLDPP